MVGVDFEAHCTFDRLKLELQSMERQWKGNEKVSLSKKTNGNVIGTRSSWFNCALRDNEAVYWVIIGHYEAVAVGI